MDTYIFYNCCCLDVVCNIIYIAKGFQSGCSKTILAEGDPVFDGMASFGLSVNQF